MPVTSRDYYQLHVGERYRFNFSGSPAGYGVLMGIVKETGYLAFEDKDGEITFYNPALLCTLKQETYPS